MGRLTYWIMVLLTSVAIIFLFVWLFLANPPWFSPLSGARQVPGLYIITLPVSSHSCALADKREILRDTDWDWIPNACDNCPLVANFKQIDSDGDGTGDACDICPFWQHGTDESDSDNDGIPAACDNCPLAANRDQRDSNGNGVGDACE